MTTRCRRSRKPPHLPAGPPPTFNELLDKLHVPPEQTEQSVAQVEAERKEFVRNCTTVRTRLQNANRFVFDMHSKRMQSWDILMLALLTFTATVTPFEVCMIVAKGSFNALWYLNLLVKCDRHAASNPPSGSFSRRL